VDSTLLDSHGNDDSGALACASDPPSPSSAPTEAQELEEKIQLRHGAGADLLTRVVVPLQVALCGTDALEIQHVGGRALQLKIQPGEIQTGTVRVLLGHGLPASHGQSAGNLLVAFEIKMPEQVRNQPRHVPAGRSCPLPVPAHPAILPTPVHSSSPTGGVSDRSQFCTQ
jgi:hypothetical protein